MKPIHRAIMDNDISLFSSEVARGVDLNLPGPEDMTPLHIAAHHGRAEFAKVLLDANVDVDPVNYWGNTPLWFAVQKHKRSPDGSLIRMLIQHGADPSATANPHSSPIELARLLAGFPPQLLELLERGAATKPDKVD